MVGCRALLALAPLTGASPLSCPPPPEMSHSLSPDHLLHATKLEQLVFKMLSVCIHMVANGLHESMQQLLKG